MNINGFFIRAILVYPGALVKYGILRFFNRKVSFKECIGDLYITNFIGLVAVFLLIVLFNYIRTIL